MSFCSTIYSHSLVGQKTPSLQELNEGLKRCTTHIKYNGKLFLPLRTLSTSMATTLYCISNICYILVNIYEINLIAKSYILLWKTCEDNPYIKVELLCQSYPKQYHNIFLSFFNESKVYWDEYFLFVCCFLFCDIYQITNVLLSMCKIHSNLIISREQIQKFYILLSLSPSNFGNVDIIYKSLDSLITTTNNNLTPINNNQQSQSQKIQPKIYSIKNFIEYINKSIPYQQIIINFRQNIIMSTLSLRIYKNIKLRQDFYDINGGKTIPPSEPLLSIIYRRLFTHEPPPYYYDFGLQMKKGNEFDQVVNGIRHMFGYSNRSRKCVSLPNYYVDKNSIEIYDNNNNNNINNDNNNNTNNYNNGNNVNEKGKEMKRSFLFRRKVKSCLLFNSVISNNTNNNNNDKDKIKKNDVLNITDKSYFHKKHINLLYRSKIAPLDEGDDI